MELREEIAQAVDQKIAGTGQFLVDVKVSPGKIAVILDHPAGVKIDDCVTINRYLREKFDDAGIFESHELEVGSPGIDEPLKVLPQFEKSKGKKVAVVTFDGMKRTGKLIGSDEQGITVEEEVNVKSGNKKEKQYQINHIPFTQIKETRVIFSFDKIN